MTTTARSRRRHRSRGMATAEYAVGLAGAACIACIVLKMGEDGWGGWITDIFTTLDDIGSWLGLRSTPRWVPLRGLW